MLGSIRCWTSIFLIVSRAYSRVYRGSTTLRPRAPSRCGYGIRSEAERIIVRFLTISQLCFLWEVSGHVTC